ncbi:MAG TPA: hypothetical protein VHP99_06185 [Pyrinomonadaceae bacterium]|nr:hypothetical protein [Pyrinomonadaceae bacterium]
MLSSIGVIGQAVATKASERDEYEVYSALLTHLVANDGRRMIIIGSPACCGNAAVSLGFARYPYQQSAPVSEQVFDDFRRRNSEKLPLQEFFTLQTQYAIVDRLEVMNLIAKPTVDFGRFYAKYPGSRGFFHLSRIGFNQTRDQAFVFSCMFYERNSSECLYPMDANQDNCQSCWFVVLAKKNGVWEVTSKALHTVYPT